MDTDKYKQATSVALLREYELFLLGAIQDVKRDQTGLIDGTCEEIALEYKRREGVKQGADLLLAKIRAYGKGS